MRDIDYVNNDVKVVDHCHTTEKYWGSAHRAYNINVKLNHKSPVVFYKLKNYYSHFIMQKLGKFNLQTNVIPNGLQKYMSFTISNKLMFICSFQFISSLLDGLVKILGRHDFKYLNQEVHNNMLDIVTQ